MKKCIKAVNVDFTKTCCEEAQNTHSASKECIQHTDSSNKREQKGGHLLTKRNYIVKRDTPERETVCASECVWEREKEKGHETDREKDLQGTLDLTGGDGRPFWGCCVCVWQMEWRDRMCLQSRAASTTGSRTQDMYMWSCEKEKDWKWERLTFIKTELVWKMTF